MTKTFKIGGIHPPSYKLSAEQKIKTAPLPEQAVLFLSQHTGKPAIPIVQKNDKVKVGQLIARADGFMSANVHSPVSGKIAKIDEATDVNGYRKTAIFIDVAGDEWLPEIDRTDILNVTCNLNAQQIIEKIRAAGIVGLGGATFPTHVKLTIPEGKKADVLLVNAAECEPFLSSDHRLILEKGREIMMGVHVLMKAINVREAIVGIENNKTDAIEHLEKISSRHLGISVLPLKVKYPQGSEKQLIEALTGKRVPSGKLPVDVGAIVVNVGTVFAVYEAVQKNKPLIESIMTVSGTAVEEPSNVCVRLGTPLADIACFPADTAKIVVGGPMMGKALADLNTPVSKGYSALLAFPEKDARREEAQRCIRCTKCIEACPMGLEPYLLVKYAQRMMWEEMETAYIADCIQCGCCAYSCPSHIPLLDYLRTYKFNLFKSSIVQ